MKNLLIVDDLMTSCAHDPCMTEIFYEGSHHRSISVILLCQNLYYSKSPTQRRNCHYVVLFKNPNDLQSVMTFARQINPRKTKEFLQTYENATLKPHGYLLLDFKQATDDKDRFLPNILNNVTNEEIHYGDQHETDDIKGMMLDSSCHSEETSQRGNIYSFEDNNMVSCDDCGIVLDNIHDLQQHLKLWCPMKNFNTMKKQNTVAPSVCGMKRQWDDNYDMKQQWDDDLDSSGQKQYMHTGTTYKYEPDPKKAKGNKKREHECFAPIRHDISHKWEESIKDAQAEYMKEGYTKKTAKAKSVNDNIKEIRKDLRETYANFIKHWMDLNENSQIHQKVMSKVEELHDLEKFDWIDAARLAIKQYKPIINVNVMPEQEENDDDDDDDDGNESETEED
jgi:hypothetical protein